MRAGPNELKVSYICIGNTQFSQYFDTMMSLCCLICTDEITKCIYKTPKNMARNIIPAADFA